MAATVSGEAKPKKFLTGPRMIEDQGSFFVGGVTKVTESPRARWGDASSAVFTPSKVKLFG